MQAAGLGACILRVFLVLMPDYLRFHAQANNRLVGVHDGWQRLCQHDHGLSPYFDHESENQSLVESTQGSSATLSCLVHNLGHRVVSWIRRTAEDLQILTIGEVSHTSDSRIEAEYLYPHRWLLKINPVLVNDSGDYLCQISSDPPLIRVLHFIVTAPTPSIRLIDPDGNKLPKDLFYDSGSGVELHCEVQPLWMKPAVFHWLKWDRPFDLDVWRGGIGIRKEMKLSRAISILNIANASSGDSGNYTCQAGDLKGSIMIHILKGENRAAMQHAINAHLRATLFLQYPLALFIIACLYSLTVQ